MSGRTSLEQALEAQQELLESSLALVFSAYDDAVKRNARAPVVILLDCEDTIGGEIARGWLGDEAVSDAILAQHDEDDSGETTTVFAYAFPWKKCRREIPAVFPYLAPVFEAEYPTGGILAVSVTSGGASALTVPPDARP